MGPVALLGSGEYTPAMNEVDRFLLDMAAGAGPYRVALLPTASGLEDGSPARWNALGVRHFEALGVRDIVPSAIIDRSGATDPANAQALAGCSLYYLSGGNPRHVIDSLGGTPSWEAILTAHQHGAAVAGCSAGAMAMNAYTVSVRQLRTTGQGSWSPSLGLVPNVVVLPHFDRMAGFVGEGAVRDLLSQVPDGCTVVGIDEDTALVRIKLPNVGLARWRVMGRQCVTIFEHGQARERVSNGQEIDL